MFVSSSYKSHIFVSLPNLKYEVISYENKVYTLSNTFYFSIFGFYTKSAEYISSIN